MSNRPKIARRDEVDPDPEEVVNSERAVDGLAEDLANLQEGLVGVYKLPDRDSGPGAPRFCFSCNITESHGLFNIQERALRYGAGDFVIYQRDPDSGRMRTVGRFGLALPEGVAAAPAAPAPPAIPPEISDWLRTQSARPSGSDLVEFLKPLVPELMKLATQYVSTKREDPMSAFMKGMELARTAQPAATKPADPLDMIDRLLEVRAKLADTMDREGPTDMGAAVLRMIGEVLPKAIEAEQPKAPPATLNPTPAQGSPHMADQNTLWLDSLLSAARSDRDPMVYAALACDLSDSSPVLAAELEQIARGTPEAAIARLGSMKSDFLAPQIAPWLSRLHAELRLELGIDEPAPKVVKK
ncbi:MAG: hypothetical protein ACYCUI_11555 [Vulcanimicrobiaceae bacterium]